MADISKGRSMDSISKQPESAEKPKGFEFKRLIPEEFPKYKKIIEDLEWDPGDTSEGRVKTMERIPELKKLFLQSMNGSNRIKLFLIMDGEKVDGFAAMQIGAQDSLGKRVGTITHLWLSERRRQGGTLMDVLDSAQKHMHDKEDCTEGVINAPNALPTFERVAGHTKPSNFFTFTGGEDEARRAAVERKVA